MFGQNIENNTHKWIPFHSNHRIHAFLLRHGGRERDSAAIRKQEVYVNPTCLQKLNRTCTMSRLSKCISSPSVGVLEKIPIWVSLTCSWMWQDFWKRSPKNKNPMCDLCFFNALEIQSSFLCNSCIENKIFVFYNLDFRFNRMHSWGITGLFNLLVSEFRWRLETESTKK